jgi:ribonucleotide reductase alpha subunit
MHIIEKCMIDPNANDDWQLKDPHNGEVREVVSAKSLWQSILEMRMQTGEPYIHYIDTSNEAMPQWQKDLGLKIRQSNLCSEIILPTNGERTAVCCLSSLNLEYYDDWKENKIFLYRQNINQGQPAARNLGLKKSKSIFIAFIDSDVLWEKNKLKKQIRFMKDNNYKFTYSDYISFYNNNKKKVIVPDNYDYNFFIRNTSIATSTMIIRRNLINNVIFPPMRLCEDFYFKCLILKKTKAYKCSLVYSHYRIRNNSLQNSVK